MQGDHTRAHKLHPAPQDLFILDIWEHGTPRDRILLQLVKAIGFPYDGFWKNGKCQWQKKKKKKKLSLFLDSDMPGK